VSADYVLDDPLHQLSQDDLVNIILARLNEAAHLNDHAAFFPLIGAVGGIRQSALAPFGEAITKDQREQMRAGLADAHRALDAQFGPQMRERLNLMFGGVRFLVDHWRNRKTEAVPVQGQFLEASALAKTLELFLEFSRLWVCVEQIHGEVTAGRQEVLAELLDVSGFVADEGGTI
jgi:hypothetical protein